MFDLKILNGTVYDGTGATGIKANVAIKDGRIAEIGTCDGDSVATIDADGLAVSPGFIDVHTHYDAQAFWDPTFSPSCFHGVTTVLGGFCGFSIAPMTADAAPYLRSMLARVEGMPLETLEVALDWEWRSFGDFLGRLDGHIGLNAGFFCGHSAIRRIVMGERAVGEEATPQDIEAMKALLRKSLEEGALGFSTTISPSHNDGDGQPVPSRWASREELVELAGVVREFEGTGLELLPDLALPAGTQELLTDFSLAGQRPVNWNVLSIGGADATSRARLARQLALSDYARAHGAEVVALAAPCSPNLFLNLLNGVLLDNNPGLWRTIFRVPPKERIEQFRDPEVRRQLADDIGRVADGAPGATMAKIGRFYVTSVVSEANRPYEGRRVSEIAATEKREEIDVLLDIAIADDLRTTFCPAERGEDPDTYRLRGDVWRDDRTLIGASDAGAHLDMIDTFAFSTIVLERGVRQYGVISLEEAIHQMTELPARFMGIKDRGRLAPGMIADVVVFDPATVARKPVHYRHDLPGGSFRLYAESEGIRSVIVNGTEVVCDGVHTGAMVGKILRSGQDTYTNKLTGRSEQGAEVS